MLIESSHFMCELQSRKLPHNVFQGYDVIVLQLSTVEGAVTRYLVGRYRSLSCISLVERED